MRKQAEHYKNAIMLQGLFLNRVIGCYNAFQVSVQMKTIIQEVYKTEIEK